MLEPGTIVRVWDGDCFRIGRFEGTIERSRKRFGWRRVSVRVLTERGDQGWHFIWRERRFPPEHVRRIED
jgi:hypothetical protein